MSASLSLIRPSVAELKALIETDRAPSPWAAIQRGEVFDRCADFTEQYSDLLTDARIDHVTLEKYHHHLLAVHTSDRGVVLLDPTFNQFHYNEPGYYFLGSPEELMTFIDKHGGMDSVMEPYAAMMNDRLTFRECFTGHDIYTPMDVYFRYNGQSQADYARPYEESLRGLGMYTNPSPWVNYVKERSARSSNEVSP